MDVDDLSREQRLRKLAAQHQASTLETLLPLVDLGELAFLVAHLPRHRIVQLAAACAATVCDMMSPRVVTTLGHIVVCARGPQMVALPTVRVGSGPGVGVQQFLGAEADALLSVLPAGDYTAPFLPKSVAGVAWAFGVDVSDMDDAIRLQRERHDKAESERALALGHLHATLAVGAVAAAARVRPPSKGRPARIRAPAMCLVSAARHAAVATFARSGGFVVDGADLPEGPGDDYSEAYADLIRTHVTVGELAATWATAADHPLLG